MFYLRRWTLWIMNYTIIDLVSLCRNVYACTYTHGYAWTHAHIHTWMHACFHMHTCTHTHTQIHRQSNSNLQQPLNLSTDELLHWVSAVAWHGILQSLTSLWCPLNEAEWMNVRHMLPLLTSLLPYFSWIKNVSLLKRYELLVRNNMKTECFMNVDFRSALTEDTLHHTWS